MHGLFDCHSIGQDEIGTMVDARMDRPVLWTMRLKDISLLSFLVSKGLPY